jgi:hypothetical protein
MGEKLLGLHMDDKNQAKAIAESFNSAFFHHGYPVGRREASEAGLKVVNAEEVELADLLWSVWTDVAAEMLMDSPFDPVIEVMKDADTRDRLTTVPTLNVTADLPAQVAVDYGLFLALVESTRRRSQFRETGKLNAISMPDMNLQLTRIRTEVGWHTESVTNAHNGRNRPRED